MGKQNQIFERTEKKYRLNARQYNAFINGVEGKIKEDQYGTHTISNIYYDTDDYELIRHSLDKPKYKEKFRIRGYGIISNESTVFMELKKKFNGVVYKRRASMTYKQMNRYLVNGVLPDGRQHEQQILKEIQYFLSYYNPGPKVLLAYERTAFEGTTDPSLRITFDQNIRSRGRELDLICGDHGRVLNEPAYLMEIKVFYAYPVWLSRLLAELEIYPVSFSKYGTIYKQFISNSKSGESEEEELCLQAHLAV